MKKIVLLLLLCLCFIITGCSQNGGMMLIKKPNGTLIERYFVPFPQDEIIRLTGNNILAQQKVSELLSNVKSECDSQIFDTLINNFKQALIYDTTLSQEEKEYLFAGVEYSSNIPSENFYILGSITDISYEITFKDSDCYNYFKKSNNFINEEKVIEISSNIFTTTTKVIKDPLFDNIFQNTITIGQNFVTQVENQMINVYGNYTWQELKEALNFDECASKFTFTYVVPSARFHSNASEITQSGGYYYHTWNIPKDNLDENGNSVVKMEYWTISANRWVWYAVTLFGAFVVALLVYSIGKLKEENKNKKEKDKKNIFIVKK